MTRIDLPYIRVVTPKRGGTYYYFDTGKKNATGNKLYVKLPPPGDPSFGGRYASLKAARTRRAKGEPVITEVTFPALVRLYEKSPAFTKLGANTKLYYTRYLADVAALWCDVPIKEITPGDVRELMDAKADQIGVANQMLKVIRVSLAWAKGREYIKDNPATDIPRFDSDPYEPWPDNILAAALASDDEAVRVTTALLYYTALRISDAARVSWSILAENGVTIVPKKTKREKPEPLFIPLHPELRAILEGATRKHVTVLTNKSATGPATKESTIKLVAAFGKAHGAHLVTHGLRKNAVIALLEAGCSVAETAAISGQSLQLVEHYAKRRNQKKLATAAILRWEKR